jgi:hypothetical protein
MRRERILGEREGAMRDENRAEGKVLWDASLVACCRRMLASE